MVARKPGRSQQLEKSGQRHSAARSSPTACCRARVAESGRNAIVAAVEDSIRPPLAPRIRGIRPQNIPRCFQDAQRDRFAVMRHEIRHAVSASNLRHKLRKRNRVREIDAGRGLAARGGRLRKSAASRMPAQVRPPSGSLSTGACRSVQKRETIRGTRAGYAAARDRDRPA